MATMVDDPHLSSDVATAPPAPPPARRISVLGRLFRRTEKPPASFVIAQLNARLQPLHRNEHFEEGLDDKLRATRTGEISGGGTMQSATGEVTFCDIEVKLRCPAPDAERLVIETLEALGAPKGSKLEIGGEDRAIPFGVSEGLAVYLDGAQLSTGEQGPRGLEQIERELERLLDDQGSVYSHWRGPSETAFYLYGPSYAEMARRIEPFLRASPLGAGYRLEQIA